MGLRLVVLGQKACGLGPGATRRFQQLEPGKSTLLCLLRNLGIGIGAVRARTLGPRLPDVQGIRSNCCRLSR